MKVGVGGRWVGGRWVGRRWSVGRRSVVRGFNKTLIINNWFSYVTFKSVDIYQTNQAQDRQKFLKRALFRRIQQLHIHFKNK